MKKIKVFLTDDHQMLLDGLQAFLSNEPQLEITGSARSGEDTLAALQENPVDVVILDISMPGGMDGIETAVQIRKKSPNTRIVLLTTFGDGDHILKALRKDIHGYVLKDKSKETLVAAIHSVMSGNRYFSPDLLNRIDFTTEHDDEEEEVTLTNRELQILKYMVQNPSITSRGIADQLFIARTTVEKHVQNIKEKLGLHKNVELVMYAMEKKLFD